MIGHQKYILVVLSFFALVFTLYLNKSEATAKQGPICFENISHVDKVGINHKLHHEISHCKK